MDDALSPQRMSIAFPAGQIGLTNPNLNCDFGEARSNWFAPAHSPSKALLELPPQCLSWTLSSQSTNFPYLAVYEMSQAQISESLFNSETLTFSNLAVLAALNFIYLFIYFLFLELCDIDKISAGFLTSTQILCSEAWVPKLIKYKNITTLSFFFK